MTIDTYKHPFLLWLMGEQHYALHLYYSFFKDTTIIGHIHGENSQLYV